MDVPRAADPAAAIDHVIDWRGKLQVDGQPPSPRCGHSFSQFPRSGVLVLFGGHDASKTYLNDMYIFNANRSTWTRVEYPERGNLPPPRAQHTLTVISPSTLVLFGGETGSAENPVALNDLWTFDLRSKRWRQVHASVSQESQFICPSPRFAHTAVFSDGTGRRTLIPPALYVYGGSCDRAKGTVFRLRIDTWRWDALEIDEVNGADPGNGSLPVERERHAAVWWPGDSGGMVVVGGDAGGTLMGDVWLLQPTLPSLKKWRWYRLVMRVSRNIPQNRLLPCAGHSLIQLPADPSIVIVWGGVSHGGTDSSPGSDATLIQLNKQVTTAVSMQGTEVPKRRFMHSLVAFPSSSQHRLLLYGGFEVEQATQGEKRLSDGVQWAIVNTTPQASAAATAITAEGNIQSRQAQAQGPASSSLGDQANGSVSGPHKPALATPLTPDSIDSGGYAAPIARGTPLTGRILDVTEVGHFVSVVIGDKECKGVLVVNPCTVRTVKPQGNEGEKSLEKRPSHSPSGTMNAGTSGGMGNSLPSTSGVSSRPAISASDDVVVIDGAGGSEIPQPVVPPTSNLVPAHLREHHPPSAGPALGASNSRRSAGILASGSQSTPLLSGVILSNGRENGAQAGSFHGVSVASTSAPGPHVRGTSLPGSSIAVASGIRPPAHADPRVIEPLASRNGGSGTLSQGVVASGTIRPPSRVDESVAQPGYQPATGVSGQYVSPAASAGLRAPAGVLQNRESIRSQVPMPGRVASDVGAVDMRHSVPPSGSAYSVIASGNVVSPSRSLSAPAPAVLQASQHVMPPSSAPAGSHRDLPRTSTVGGHPAGERGARLEIASPGMKSSIPLSQGGTGVPVSSVEMHNMERHRAAGSSEGAGPARLSAEPSVAGSFRDTQMAGVTAAKPGTQSMPSNPPAQHAPVTVVKMTDLQHSNAVSPDSSSEHAAKRQRVEHRSLELAQSRSVAANVQTGVPVGGPLEQAATPVHGSQARVPVVHEPLKADSTPFLPNVRGEESGPDEIIDLG